MHFVGLFLSSSSKLFNLLDFYKGSQMNNRTSDRNLSLESTKETDMKCVQNFVSEVDTV